VRWLVDECVDAALAILLRELGHDVIYMSDVAPRATDTEVMARAYSENRILLTEDKDFGRSGLPTSKTGSRHRASAHQFSAALAQGDTTAGSHRSVWRDIVRTLHGYRGGAVPLAPAATTVAMNCDRPPTLAGDVPYHRRLRCGYLPSPA
jgi:hypothetical protein